MMAKMGHNEEFLTCFLKEKVVPNLLSLFNKNIYEMMHL
jgi:hypothetical protein